MIERRDCGGLEHFTQQLTVIEDVIKSAFNANQVIGFNEEPIAPDVEAVFRLIPFDRPHPYIELVQSEIQLIARTIWPRTTAVWVCPEQVLTAPIWQDFRNELLDKFSLSHVVTIRTLFNMPLTMSVIIANRKSGQSRNICMAHAISSKSDFERIISTSNGSDCSQIKQSDLTAERIDPYFYKDEWRTVENELNTIPTRTLDSLANIKRGLPFHSASIDGSRYRVITSRNIVDNSVIGRNDDRHFDKFEFGRGTNRTQQLIDEAVLRGGDILVSLMGPIKIGIVPQYNNDEKWVANGHLAIIRGDNNKFIADLLTSEDTRLLLFSQLERQQRGSVTIRSLSIRDLHTLRVPEINTGYEYNKLSKAELATSTPAELTDIAQALSILKAGQATDSDKLNALYEIVSRIDTNVISAKNTLDKVLNIVEQVSENLDKVKSENRSLDEKLFLIGSHVDDMCKRIIDSAHEQIKIYFSLLENNMASWDSLDELSKEFLAMGEYLYSKLQADKPLDFSPAILQYCRSLEHELAQKTFIPFIIKLIGEKGDELTIFLEKDKTNSKVSKFVGTITKCRRDGMEKFNLTLGDMAWILNLAVNSDTTVTESPLLFSLRHFISSDDHKAVKIDKTILSKLSLQEIIDFRNSCAHPSKLERESAEKCKKMIPPAIDSFEGFE